MTIQIDLQTQVTNRLNAITEGITNALESTGAGRVVDKSAAEQAQYDIGAFMYEAKQLFQGNKKRYGVWRDTHIIGNGQCVVDKRTLTRWTSLSEFGSLEQCRKVGFTNVYKLSGKRYASLREQVTAILLGESDIESDLISSMFKEFDNQLKTEKKLKDNVANDDLLNKLAGLEARIVELESENASLRHLIDQAYSDAA
ncbi:hypothetical protein P3696_18775 [Vibrio parahaemolyticus]|nr:hypothetical protein [Vibrio parahaemolyticus]MDF5500512.1 hypothetical protein [Vibrio parahaemolyticus]MDF5511246.1 hypothetical protein [Vibrio parahaemolyticus]MDF5558881.1 hypothetical protein [Vibrio parahaemolyticus]